MKTLIVLLALFGAGFGSTAIAQCQLNISCGHSPEGLAFDTSGNLWAAFYDTNTVANLGIPTGPVIFAPTSVTSFHTGLNGPTRLAFSYPLVSCGLSPAPAAVLNVTNSLGNTVSLYAVSEYGTPLLATVSGVQRPLGIAVDANCTAFVADNSTSAISAIGIWWDDPYFPPVIDSESSINADSIGDRFDAPGALAFSGQNLFVATNDGTVRSYNDIAFWYGILIGLPDTEVAPLVTFADGASGGPTGIAFDSQGNVYVCYYYSSDVVKYSPQGAKLLTITNAVSQPEGIAVQPSTGEIYVANTGNGGFITVYNPTGNYAGRLFNF